MSEMVEMFKWLLFGEPSEDLMFARAFLVLGLAPVLAALL